jgi:hypothetical protein
MRCSSLRDYQKREMLHTVVSVSRPFVARRLVPT